MIRLDDYTFQQTFAVNCPASPSHSRLCHIPAGIKFNPFIRWMNAVIELTYGGAGQSTNSI